MKMGFKDLYNIYKLYKDEQKKQKNLELLLGSPLNLATLNDFWAYAERSDRECYIKLKDGTEIVLKPTTKLTDLPVEKPIFTGRFSNGTQT
jgi:hypothetical protein